MLRSLRKEHFCFALYCRFKSVHASALMFDMYLNVIVLKNTRSCTKCYLFQRGMIILHSWTFSLFGNDSTS